MAHGADAQGYNVHSAKRATKHGADDNHAYPTRSCRPLASHARDVSSAQAAARFDVTETTIAETQRAIAEHRISCRQVIEQYLERIRAYDQGTHLNSLVLVNPNALAEADRFDAEFKLTQKIHGLQCIGVIVKDNYDTKDLQTTGGSLAMKWFVPATDAFMVQRIRAGRRHHSGKIEHGGMGVQPL